MDYPIYKVYGYIGGRFKMNTRICAVCGKKKPIDQFGKGIKVPKTTCLECYKKTCKETKGGD